MSDEIKKAPIEQKELPSVKELADRLGVHVYTEVKQKPIEEDGSQIGVPLARLFVCDEPVSPYLPINELDLMVVGILVFSPAIKQAVDKAHKAIEEE